MWMLPEVKGAEGLMYLRGCPSVRAGVRNASRARQAAWRRASIVCGSYFLGRSGISIEHIRGHKYRRPKGTSAG